VALQGPIPVEFALVFPDGVYAAGVFEPVRDFDASSNGRFVQSKDKATGLPLWTVEVIDADKEARTRTVKVKVAAPDQPVLPASPAGVPFVSSICGLGLYIGSDGWVTCHRYPGKTPILAISAGGASLSIGIKDRDATDEAAVEFARALLRTVQEFAAEVERIRTARLAGADDANADSNSGDGDGTAKATDSKAA
jgi:hypothetical protein